VPVLPPLPRLESRRTVNASWLTEPVEQFTQTRYRCPYCRRSWTSLKRANEHRDQCWYGHGCMSCRHVEQAYGGNYVTGCEAGVDLSDPDYPEQVRPRGNCGQWGSR
jgi:hypothetical protein